MSDNDILMRLRSYIAMAGWEDSGLAFVTRADLCEADNTIQILRNIQKGNGATIQERGDVIEHLKCEIDVFRTDLDSARKEIRMLRENAEADMAIAANTIRARAAESGALQTELASARKVLEAEREKTRADALAIANTVRLRDAEIARLQLSEQALYDKNIVLTERARQMNAWNETLRSENAARRAMVTPAAPHDAAPDAARVQELRGGADAARAAQISEAPPVRYEGRTIASRDAAGALRAFTSLSINHPESGWQPFAALIDPLAEMSDRCVLMLRRRRE